MKKVACVISFILILSLCSFANADSKTNGPKEPREAFGFVERYMERLLKLEEITNKDDLYTPLRDHLQYNINMIEGRLHVNCDAGALLLNQEDLSIIEYETMFAWLGDSRIKTKDDSERIVAAISALEYDGIDESIKGTIPIIYKSMSIARKLVNEFSDENSPLWAGEMVQVYEGNYTYFLDLFESDGQEMVFLTAR